MRIYLAASFHRHPELREYAETLAEHGHQSTASWIHVNKDDAVETFYKERWEHAEADLDDICGSEVLICFSETDGGRARGGKHFEVGYALAIGLMVIIVGTKEIIFHELPTMIVVEFFDEALEIIDGMSYENKTPS